VPLTEHEAFDLVAYQGTRFLRIQVKYRAAVDGAIYIPFSTCWADRNGTHKQPIDKSAIDFVCVYCPDTKQCYYIDPRRHRESVKLRIAPAKNGQSKGVLWADDFTDVPNSAP
jgi:hypothetical protein